VIRAVLDTNTLASGIVAAGGTIAVVIDAWLVRGLYSVVLSPEILDELERTLRKPYFTQRQTASDIAGYLAAVRATAAIIPVTTPLPTVVRTRADNLVLATAETGGVPYVVTGDRELQNLGRYRSITILSPRQFLEVLRQQGEGENA